MRSVSRRSACSASRIEGLGRPIGGSRWLGTPCVCHNDGVMAELAADGGCLTVDMHDPAAIASAIGQISTDPTLYDRLAAQAAARKARTWDDYARGIMGIIEQAEDHVPRSDDWAERLYPDCLTTDLHMTDSEPPPLTGP